jgi:energy-coupling factor transport system permease protein
MKFAYRKRETAFYNLNPWARIAYLSALFYLSVLFSSIVIQLAVLLLIVITAFLAGVAREALYFSRFIVYMSGFLAIISVIFGPGGKTIYSIASIYITLSPVLFSISMTIRLISSVMSFEMLLLTVDPDSIMSILSRLSRKTAGALLISTRLMPVMSNEGEEILQAFEARGVPLRSGRLPDRLKAVSHVLYPMLYSSMDRGIAVAEAMETRGFPSRWRHRKETLSRFDLFHIGASIFSVLSFTLLSIYGIGEADYYSVTSIYAGYSLIGVLAVLTVNMPFFMFTGRQKFASNQGSEVPV